ncbi:unnamed protein product [Auanema sp. JU1783]|nr:unnamed protein product [Auanema sp. JU1783]
MSFYDKQGSSAQISDGRRTWDEAEYERKAKERLAEAQTADSKKLGLLKKDEPPVKKKGLEYRDFQLDLDSKVGKAIVISKTTPAAESGGFYCDICDCVIKDSLNFLDHMNGKMHIKNLGMSMKVKRSTLEDVQDRFAYKKWEKEQERRQKEKEANSEDVALEQAKINDAKLSKQERKRKREKEEEVEEETEGLDPDIQAMMGISGFGTSKKK